MKNISAHRYSSRPSIGHRLRPALLLGMSALLLLGAEQAAAGTISGKVVGRERYVKNTVVAIKAIAGDFKTPTEQPVMDQKDMQFVPRVLPVLKGTTVKFVNSDAAEHTVFSPDGESYDLGSWGQGGSKTWTFKETGTYTQLCKLHALMVAYVVVRDNPYFSVTDSAGAFTIDNVPPGDYELEIWNERMRAEPVSVNVTGGKTPGVEIELLR
ncbi:MAG: hypothetical protein H8E45_03500 [Proteobacteria bacterium]|nr:hypothetical protein [Pseudomonadota bacterium]